VHLLGIVDLLDEDGPPGTATWVCRPKRSKEPWFLHVKRIRNNAASQAKFRFHHAHAIDYAPRIALGAPAIAI